MGNNELKNKQQGKHPDSDVFQTPDKATETIVPFLRPGATIWEPCAAQGYMARCLSSHGFNVIASDILPEERISKLGEIVYPVEYKKDFLRWRPKAKIDYIISNFPFSIGHICIERAYQLETPWAAIMKFDQWTAWRNQKLFRKHGNQPIIFNKRVNFKPPFKPWGESAGAWFPVAWFTWGILNGTDSPNEGNKHYYVNLTDAENTDFENGRKNFEAPPKPQQSEMF